MKYHCYITFFWEGSWHWDYTIWESILILRIMWQLYTVMKLCAIIRLQSFNHFLKIYYSAYRLHGSALKWPVAYKGYFFLSIKTDWSKPKAAAFKVQLFLRANFLDQNVVLITEVQCIYLLYNFRFMVIFQPIQGW